MNADDTETLIPKSVVTDDGVVIPVNGGATQIRLEDRGMTFTDMEASGVSYAKAAASYVSARGLFTGTEVGVFSPEMAMSREMMMAVLARLDGVEARGDQTYPMGIAWAKEKGLAIEGDPAADVTRAEMAVIFWKYAGAQESDYDLAGFADAGELNGDTLAAFRWCAEKGIMQGWGGALHHGESAERAQVAQMIWNFNNAVLNVK